jgi:dehydrogenase/reductase SDR family protein 4
MSSTEKVCVITGGTKGIGLDTALRFGLEGFSVFICSRRQANVDAALLELKQKGVAKAFGVACNVGKVGAIDAFLDFVQQHVDHIDVLVSNVACNPYFGSVMDTPEKAYDKIMSLNVKSHFLLVQKALPLIPEHKNSSVIFVSSYAGYQPNPLLGIYSLSKTALIGLTKVLSMELGPVGIRVNCLAPGVIKTGFSKMLWQEGDIAEASLAHTPLGRFGKPSEMAGVAWFLASKDASYITGETIVASGGVPSRL